MTLEECEPETKVKWQSLVDDENLPPVPADAPWVKGKVLIKTASGKVVVQVSQDNGFLVHYTVSPHQLTKDE